MVKNQWLDLDLDFLNFHMEPMNALKRIIHGISGKIPCAIVIEHQKTLPHLKKAISNGDLQTPMEIFHVDEHHDFYGHRIKLDEPDDPYGCNDHIPQCGNYMYHVNTKWYKNYWWVRPHQTGLDMLDWPEAQQQMREVNINLHKTWRFAWNPRKIGLLTVALSPDYISGDLASHIPALFKILEDKFNPHTVVRRKNLSDYRCPGTLVPLGHSPAHWRTIKKAA